jgi:phosphatidylserine/phosphatidylglycerophosphate/cardiolipin synthase-like enzyme
MTDIAPPTHTTPIQKGQCTGNVTPKWFVDESEYHAHEATFRPLVMGKEAFREVYLAIAAAKKSVCIICWGFQPSMYFVRDGTQMMIGQLLEKKAREEGVIVRILCWAFQPTDDTKVNATGFQVSFRGNDYGLGESNTPGRWLVRIGDRPASSTEAQYQYDERWYAIYDRKQPPAGESRRRKVFSDAEFPKDKLLFTSRTYLSTDKEDIGRLKYEDKGLAQETKKTLKSFPSHHQKVVVVDHEDPQRALGFVMGHNMLDNYWDTPEHSCIVRMPNVGRNGFRPFHDYSTRVTGPIIGDLFRNFAHAWQRETGESIPIPNFLPYPLHGNDDRAMCQILRTQPQHGKEDIKKCYLQAVNNATQYIAIENQYFRWPPLATKIKKAAARMVECGRIPEKHGYLYLFVITNSSDAGMGVGTVNTYRMLNALGRADRIPEVARHERLEVLDRKLKATEQELAATEKGLDEVEKMKKPLLGELKSLDIQAGMLKGLPGGNLNKRYEPINVKLAELEARKSQLEARKREAEARKRELEEQKARLEPKSWRERFFDADRTPEEIKASSVPGLKVHIATLVSPDTPPGIDWTEVYIHAKLMMIDDAFMTVGSANINTRSMQVDSELNIVHDRPEITAPLRAAQWERYTNGEVLSGTPLKKAFAKWGDIMELNAKIKSGRTEYPVAQLMQFLRSSDKITNSD